MAANQGRYGLFQLKTGIEHVVGINSPGQRIPLARLTALCHPITSPVFTDLFRSANTRRSQGVREAEVFAGIRALKIPAAYARDQWYVEAPRNCEARLAQLRTAQQQTAHAVATRERRRRVDWPIGFGSWRPSEIEVVK